MPRAAFAASASGRRVPPHRMLGWTIAALTLLLSWVVLPSAASAQQLPRVSLVLTRTGTVSPINDSLTETGVVTVTATMNKAATDTVTVTLSVAPANGFTTTDDYVVSENKVLTFAPGSTVSTGTVTVTSVDDGGVKRHARLIRITFTASSNARTAPNGTPSSFEEFSVVDDELHPTKSVVLTPTAVSENGGVATVTAKLSHPTLFGDVQIVVQTGLFPAGTPRRAEASDFTLSDNVRLVIPRGETASTGTVTVTAVDNDVFGPAQKRLGVRLYNVDRVTVSTEPGLVSNWAILTIEEDDPEPPTLSVDATPACGTAVSDTSVPPSWALVLTPAPSEEVETEYRWVTETSAGAWIGALPIRPSGRSIRAPSNTFAGLRQAYAGFSGFEFRLRDDHDVTAQCTWRFETTSTTSSLRLSASPNPVAEGESVTVTATLSAALSSGVRIPLTLTAGTAEPGDFGSLSSITIGAGSTSGTGTISTAEDADTDDETFTVALGALPSSVTAGNPGSVEVTISDDDGGGGTPPTVRLSVSPNPVDEGSSVTVTATLSSALSSGVRIPLTLTAGTAEPGDFGSLSSITIGAGSTSGTGTISTAEDADTDDETFTVALGALPSSVTAGNPGSVEVTISDDDDGGGGTPPTVRLSVSPNPVDEGSSVTVTATLSSALSSGVRIPLTLTAGTAEQGDFGALSAVTIGAGATRGTGTISTAEDADTDDETFTVALGALPSSVRPGSPSSVEVTISDDDGGGGTPPTVRLSVSPNPVDEGSSVTVTATLSSALSSGVRIPLTLTAGTAEPGDFGSLSSITIGTGSTSGTGTISTAEDADTDDETFTVALGALPSSVRPGSPSSVEVTISDDDGGSGTPPTVRLSVSPNPVDEGSSVTVTATLSSALSSGVRIPLTLTAGTAEPGDFGSLSSITIGAGSTSGTGTISTAEDADTDDETFTVALGALPSSVTAGNPGSVEVTISDDDGGGGTPPTVRLSVSPNPVDEGSSVTVTATLSSALSSGVRIPLTLTAGTAEPGDFGSLSSITIGAGSTSGTGTISTAEDADTDDETFTVALGALPSSVRPGSPSSVEVTISDDDGGSGTPPTVRLSVSPNPVDEGSSVTVTATLSSALSSGVRIPLTLTAGTAEPGDFGSLSSITIGAGSTSGTGTISTAEDADTDDETFTVALGALPSSVTAGNPGSVEVTISDDDGGGGTPPTVRLSVSPNPVDEGSSVTVTATLSSALSSGVRIPLTLTAGTAEQGDFGALSAVTIGAGATRGTGTISTAEDADTDDETFTVALGALPSSVRPGSPSSVEVTILDDDPRNRPPTVTASCEPCRVGLGGVVKLTATASDPDGDPLTYAWSAPRGRFLEPTDGTATRWRAPADTGRVTIRIRVADGRGGTASATLTIQLVNEPPAFAEPSYTFELRENEDGRRRPVPLGAAVAEDPDGDEVTYALASGAAHLFAIGTRDGAVTYVGPGEDYETEPNRYELTVRASDPHGGEATVGMTVRVANVNEAPEAAADTATTAEDEPVVIDVLANDTDVEGDDLRVESVSRPAHGTAQAAGGGRVAYAPEANYHGADRFTYTVADGNGGTAEAEVVVEVEPVNDAPVAVGAIADQALDEGGGAVALNLEPYFEDPDGDPLTYTALSSDPGVAAVSVAGAALTLTPVSYGPASIVVTARDPGGLSAVQTFAVDASDRMVRAVLDETLAAMARAHLASARMTLGRRVGPGGAGERSRLTVAGRSIPLNGLGAAAGLGASGGGTEFLFAWGGGEAGGQDTAGRRGWRLWGQGDLQTFAGDPAPERGYEGGLRTGWVGLDRALDERWLAGVAVARSRGRGDWRAGTAEGRLKTSLTAVHPYLRWSDGPTSVWTMAGAGRGSAKNERATGRVGESGLDLALGLVEIRRRFAGGFALRADAAWARLATGSGGETVDGRSAAVDQQRLGVEIAPSTRVGAMALEVFGEASARRDGGAGQTGSGLEVAFGFRAARGSVRIVGQGRMLVLNTAEGYEEWGASATARLDPGERGRGLSFSLAPTIGATSSASDRLWGARDVRALAPDGGAFTPGRGLAAEAGYGLSLFGDRFTGTPNIGLRVSDGGVRDYRIGWRLTSAVEGDPGFEVSLDATRREAANDNGSGSGAEHGVMLRSLIRW